MDTNDNTSNISKQSTIDPATLFGTPSYYRFKYKETHNLFAALSSPNSVNEKCKDIGYC